MTALPPLTLNDLVTPAGAAVLVSFITQLIVQRLSPQAQNDWGTWIALLVGVVVVTVATILTATAPLTTTVIGGAVLTGIVVGSGAVTTHNLATKTKPAQKVSALLGIAKAPPPPAAEPAVDPAGAPALEPVPVV